MFIRCIAAVFATASVLATASPAAAAGDLCPDTPAKAKVVLDGCASVDIVRQPAVFGLPVQEDLSAAVAAMPSRQATTRSAVQRAQRSIGSAMLAMGRGRVCEARRDYASGVLALRRAHENALKALPAQQAAVRARYPRGHEGDVTAGQLAAIALGLGPAALQGAIDDAARAEEAFAGPCRRLSRPLKLKGPIGSFADGPRALRVAGKTLVLASDVREDVFAGALARVRGITFDDGTGVVTEIDLEAGASKGKKVKVNIPQDLPVQCVQLRIVPFAQAGGKTELRHDIRGYQSAGKLQLEQGMRVAADQTCASKEAKDGFLKSTTSYALNVSVTYTPFSLFGGGGKTTKTKVIGFELEDGEVGGELPADAVDGNATLTVEELVKTCVGHDVLHVDAKSGKKVFRPNLDCAIKARNSAKRSYPARILRGGAYAEALYSDTTFDLDTLPSSTCRTTTVDGHRVTDGSLNDATSIRFEAEARRASGAGTACTPSQARIEKIGPREQFAIFLVDPAASAGSTSLRRLEKYGVRELSGVTWPRVVGSRGAHPFSYSARTPRLVRDLISECPDGLDSGAWTEDATPEFRTSPIPDTYFRVPFSPAALKWKVGQGQADDPNHFDPDGTLKDHPDKVKEPDGEQDPYHEDQQWDVSYGDPAELGQEIRATRAGEVVLFDRDEKYNFHPDNEGVTKNEYDIVVNVQPPYTDVGNYLWLRHADGTYTTYNHLRENSIAASTKKGDWIRRGEKIAQVGHTGQSSKPHLHFGAFMLDVPGARVTADVALHIVPSRYQDSAHPGGCWLPREGETFNSNNNLINVPRFW